ncbi:MAG: inner-rane translocator [Blastococcus sp.]|jgi:branched-chain amino acid transport system permease protein|nr:inner-rane translocator [Blastococcus sp.]
MIKFLELCISGISLGSVYALVAIGFVVIFKATRVLSLVHGSLLLLSAYVVARAEPTVGFLPAVLLGAAVAVVGAVLVQRVFLERLRRRGANYIALTMLTVGLDIILLTEVTRRIGARVYGINNPWGSEVIHWGGFSFPVARLAGIVVSFSLIALFFAAFKYTTWGVALRASADDSHTAALMGIRQSRVAGAAWAVAGALAAVAAVFLVAFPAPGLDASTSLVALKAFPAVVLGGLDSASGALVGGLSVGLVEVVLSGYGEQLSFLGGGFGSVAPWALVLLVLLVRPSGLFGSKEVARV